jgi:protein-disulfide isomerase
MPQRLSGLHSQPYVPPIKWHQHAWVRVFLGLVALAFVLFIVAFGIELRRNIDDLNFRQDLIENPDEYYATIRPALDESIPERNVNVNDFDDPVLGNPDGKVTIVEFSDFQCPFCEQSRDIVDLILDRYGDQVRFVYRDFANTSVPGHEFAEKAAIAAQCVNEQGYFKEYHDALFENQESLSDDFIIQLAGLVGADTNEFTSCLESGKYVDEVRRDLDEGIAAGVRGTPTFFVNQRMLEGSIPFELFQDVIEIELRSE